MRFKKTRTNTRPSLSKNRNLNVVISHKRRYFLNAAERERQKTMKEAKGSDHNPRDSVQCSLGHISYKVPSHRQGRILILHGWAQNSHVMAKREAATLIK